MSTTTGQSAPPASLARGRALPGTLAATLRDGIRRIGFEVRVYFRRPDQLFFTFLFPTLFYVIFATAFSAMDFGPEIGAREYYLPGMVAAGILLAGLQNLGTDIAVERSDGTLKRLAGTPLAPASYIIGKLGQVLVVGVAQIAILLAVAGLVFRAELPDDPERWGTFAWVFALGLAVSALLGIAISRLPRTGASAPAVIVPIVLVLQFASGVYLPFSSLPDWLQDASGFAPLRWMAQGMRAVFLPDSFASFEQGGPWGQWGEGWAGEWGLGLVAANLAAWLVIGFALARITFRWMRKN